MKEPYQTYYEGTLVVVAIIFVVVAALLTH